MVVMMKYRKLWQAWYGGEYDKSYPEKVAPYNSSIVFYNYVRSGNRFSYFEYNRCHTNDEGVLKACYTSMHVLAKTSVRASTIGTVVTGILLSVLTQWGLFKFYWIIVKEVLTIVVIGLGIVRFQLFVGII